MEPSPKPGYKTTEFWLSVVAALVGLTYASGIIGAETQADKIMGFASSILATLGYTVSRGLAKKG